MNIKNKKVRNISLDYCLGVIEKYIQYILETTNTKLDVKNYPKLKN